jgi:hypothetical protein
MANKLYPKAKEAFLSGAIDLTSDSIRAILVDLADYTYDAAHDHLDDVPSAARVATSADMTSITVTDGVFDAANVTWSSVTGDQSEAIIIYKHTGTDSTSDLIVYIDTASAGLPVTPNGSDITVAWSTGANKIFAITDV